MTSQIETKATKKPRKPAINMSDAIANQIDLIKDELGLNSREAVLEHLLTIRSEYMKVSGQLEDTTKLDFEKDLSSEQFEALKEISQNERVEYKVIAKNALASVIKKYKTQSENIPDFESMSLAELEEMINTGKGRTYKGLAEARITKVVQLVIEHNDNQPEKKYKWCISPTLVAKLTGSNRQAINNFFTNHKVMIDDHNTKHSLRDLDNRKGIGGTTIESLKQSLGLMDGGN
jgi:hypothetical protein